jgi:hypothetical protein
MTIRLVTSKSYLDNIRSYLPENPNSKSRVLDKINKNFDKITKSPNFIFNRNDERITDQIKKLLSIRPGRDLFKRLLKANQRLEMVFDSKKNTCLSHRGKREVIYVARDHAENRFYKHCVNRDGERMLAYAPAVISLAHELIHALHRFEEGAERVRAKKKEKINLISLEFDNLEEEETIIGKKREGTLCENVFRFHFGYPMRIDHRGLWLKGEERATASTYAFEGALVNLKSTLQESPSLINRSLPCTGTKYADKKMTPLSASILAKDLEIFNYLLQKGADVNAPDECWGTALHAAIQSDERLNMINLLLKKGARVDIRDPSGLTAYELALQRNNVYATELLAPFKPSIFRRALNVGSLVYSFCKSVFFDPLLAICRTLMNAFRFSR